MHKNAIALGHLFYSREWKTVPCWIGRYIFGGDNHPSWVGKRQLVQEFWEQTAAKDATCVCVSGTHFFILYTRYFKITKVYCFT